MTGTKNLARNHSDLMKALNMEAINFMEHSPGELKVLTTALKRANAGNTVSMLATYGEQTAEHGDGDEAMGAKLLLQILRDKA